jgi:adenylate cyclase
MKYLTHWATALITAFVLIFVHYTDNYVVETLRLKSFDLIQQTDEPVHSKDIAVVQIDEAAIEKYGQWPWKRDVLAEVIWKLREAGASVIVLPILFSEDDRLGGDNVLAEALAGNGVIIAQTGSTQANKNSVPRGVAKIGDPLPFLFEWPGMLGPIPLLGDNADGVGVLNTVPEIDGVVRRVPLIMRVGEETYPSIAVEVIRLATGAPSYQIKANQGGIEKIRVPGYPIINTDPNGQIWLRWNKTFDAISLADDDQFWSLEGKTVLVGITADGLGGLIASPTGPKYNYIPAAVTLQTVLDGDQIQRPYWAFLSELAATAIVGLLVILLAAFAPYTIVALAIVAIGGGLIWAVMHAWTTHLYLLDASIPLIALVLVSLHAVFNRFVKEFQLKQQIKKQFEHYLAPAMVKKLQEDPSLLKLGGDTRELTIMFTDIRGFTPISEQYKTNPQGLTSLINRYMTPMTALVMEKEGTVDKYIGDALMAFWNAPLDVPDQRRLATETAIQMLERLDLLNKELEDEGLLPLRIGIGINTGTVVVGNMGGEQRFDYSVLGDAVNLAARLEGQSKAYGLTFLIGEDSLDMTLDFDYIELDLIAVKGKTEGIRIFTVLMEDMEDEQWKLWHDEMLIEYRNGNFDLAITEIKKLQKDGPPTLYEYYNVMLDRCEDMIVNTPVDWDGVYIATSK